VEHAGVADEPGEDDRDPDAAVAPVLAQTEPEAAHPELRGRVQRAARGRRLARQRRDERDVPAAAGGHPRRHGVGEHDRHAQVDVERPVDLVDGEGLDRARGGQRGVGHEHVGVAGLVDQPVHLGGLGEVDGEHAGRQLGRQRLENLGPPTGEHERRATPGEGPRDGLAEPSGGAGDEDGPAGKLHGSAP
jgi:hypothetical protein